MSVQEDVLVVVRAEFDTYVNVANTEYLTQTIQTDVALTDSSSTLLS